MPNGVTHRRLGAVAGGVGALYHARDEEWQDALVEVAGGILGGAVGGMLPDRLDPPISPRHRDVFHSALVLALLLLVILETQRAACRQRAIAARSGTERREFESAAWRLVCGFMTGVQWGYVSHLAADMTTTASLPLVCRGW